MANADPIKVDGSLPPDAPSAVTRLTGPYLLGLEPMFVSQHNGQLTIALSGVPARFEARLIRDGNHFRVEGGQLEGSLMTFAEGDPSPGGTIGGVIEFRRHSDSAVDSAPGGRGLVPPKFEPSATEEDAYQTLCDGIAANPDGELLQWSLDWPKWRFIEWLTRRGAVIFHGSPNPDIKAFVPVRSSVEIMDQGGTGNLAAVYGTPFGLWAMWFAVIDRDRIEGSIQNGVMRWTDQDGHALDLYHFSVHYEYVGGDIWREGTLYLFPRDSFRPIPFFPGGPDSNEWASPSEVRPLKRISVSPEDFPFLRQVGGHDDSELIKASQIGNIVMGKVTGARRIRGGLEVELTWDAELATVMDDYLAARRKFAPDVDWQVTHSSPREVTMRLKGPEGFLQSFEKNLPSRDG